MIDSAALVLIGLLSAAPYVTRLGFYSDDWGLLASFGQAQRSGHLIAFVAGDFIGRPLQGLYLASLFEMFGLRPLGYHVVNSAVVAASVASFYLLLARLGVGRAASFATALLFLMLPQLSTVRAWYSAFQIPLSLLLALASMHLQLSFVRRSGRWFLLGAVATALASIAAYEIFAPLIAGFAVWLASRRWRRPSNGEIQAALVMACVAIAGLVYKLAFSGRSGPVADGSRYAAGMRQLVRPDYDWRVDSSLNVFATSRTHFRAPIEGLWTGFQSPPTIAVVMIAAAIGAISWWRLNDDQGHSISGQLLLAGLATFVLGNATFLIVPAVVFTSTGMGNRVHVAAALGVAMVFAALLTLFAGPRPRLFAGIVAALAVAGFVRLAEIERYWTHAPLLQMRVIDAARRDLGGVPTGSTVILDGVCPYYGPAVVFETGWDAGGALTVALGRPLVGDVVSSRMTVTPDGLRTSIYREPSFYPYGPSLFVYDPAAHSLVGLRDHDDAIAYFTSHRRSACPPGYVARGVAV